MKGKKRIIGYWIRTGKKILHKMDRKNTVFSIGENCLTDDILSRSGLESSSSPYATGRSNIEYILAFEREKFINFVNPEYLVYADVDTSKGTSKIIRNTKYSGSGQNRYHESCIHGFEFTHHDVLGDTKTRQTFQKRCNRLLELTDKNVVMVYHHRYCDETDWDLLLSHLQQLAEIYRGRGNIVRIFAFTQRLVNDERERRVESREDDGIKAYDFYTLKEWSGNDQDVFFARCDNDLIQIMVDDIRKSLV